VPSPLTSHIDIAALADGRFYMLDRDGRGVRMTAAGAVDLTFPLVDLPGTAYKMGLIGNDPLVMTLTQGADADLAQVVNIHRIDGSDEPAPPPPAEQPAVTRNPKGTLAVHGTSDADAIVVSMRYRDNRIVVRVNDDIVQSFPPRPVKRIQVFAGGGNDNVLIATALSRKAYVDGAAGDDTITGGDLADILVGGDGNDVIGGGRSNDQLFGDAGDDQLFGNGGRDILHGGDGNDRLYGGPTTVDQIFGDAGADSAANDPDDTFTDIETLLD
jgi:Ca2+-binding RTX toxin-like protein